MFILKIFKISASECVPTFNFLRVYVHQTENKHFRVEKKFQRWQHAGDIYEELAIERCGFYKDF